MPTVCGDVPPCLPPRMVRAVPTLCHPAHATHFGLLCSLCAVLNTCVLYVCVCLCVGPEVVDGKGQEPVETQNGGMVMYGKSW